MTVFLYYLQCKKGHISHIHLTEGDMYVYTHMHTHIYEDTYICICSDCELDKLSHKTSPLTMGLSFCYLLVSNSSKFYDQSRKFLVS